jgi:hypothetical protein
MVKDIGAMTAFQICVPAKNKPGMLASITATFARAKINLRAITLTSFGDSGFFHMVVDDPQEAHAALKNAGIENQLKEVVAVLIEDKPGSLNRLVQLLCSNDINVENAYGFVLESHKNAVFVVDVDKLEETLVLLEKEKFKTLDAEALNAIEPFHYMQY